MNFIDSAYAQSEGETVHETASGGSGVLGTLGINGSLFIFQLINFTLVAAVVWFLILKPVTKKMSERQKAIEHSLDNAKKIQDKLQQSEREYQARIDEAKVAANKIMEKNMADTQEVAASMRAKAKTEIEQAVEQAKRAIAAEKQAMRSEIKREAAELIVVALEKILPDVATGEADKKNIRSMLAAMKYEEKQ